jgi:hypothetical protein
MAAIAPTLGYSLLPALGQISFASRSEQTPLTAALSGLGELGGR